MMLNGNPARINPDTPMEDQAESLPYNKKWEFLHYFHYWVEYG